MVWRNHKANIVRFKKQLLSQFPSFWTHGHCILRVIYRWNLKCDLNNAIIVQFITCIVATWTLELFFASLRGNWHFVSFWLIFLSWNTGRAASEKSFSHKPSVWDQWQLCDARLPLFVMLLCTCTLKATGKLIHEQIFFASAPPHCSQIGCDGLAYYKWRK